MSDEAPLSRFLVRMGCKGWMVYDRQRKGPALVGTDPVVDLTEEQANRIKLALVAKGERKQGLSILKFT